MIEHLSVDGGTIAYESAGASGPLVVLAHGIGDSRRAYRFMTPALVEAGYRVVAVDLRGCGESSAVWDGYTRTDIAGDLIALLKHLGGPAVLVGHSISGGAATIVAAREPSLVTALVELAPFTRQQKFTVGDLGVAPFRRGALRLARAGFLGSVSAWLQYLDGAYPGPKPVDWDVRLGEIEAMLHESGRMKALQKMVQSSPADAGAALGAVRCPVLVVEGSLDPDWAHPQVEGEAIVAALTPGLGRLEVIEGAGHYPHVQLPAHAVTAVLTFLDGLDA